MMSDAPEHEHQLVRRLKQGEAAAFEQLYFHYAPRLYGKLLRLTKSDAVAEDLLQTTFLKLWLHRDRMDGEKSFGAYLFRMAENGAMDFFRQTEKDLRLREDLLLRTLLLQELPGEVAPDQEKEEQLRQVIEALPPQRRQVFTLCKLNGKSYKEVSALLNISPSTINDHIVKALRFIHHRLKEGLLLLLWFLF